MHRLIGCVRDGWEEVGLMGPEGTGYLTDNGETVELMCSQRTEDWR